MKNSNHVFYKWLYLGKLIKSLIFIFKSKLNEVKQKESVIVLSSVDKHQKK